MKGFMKGTNGRRYAQELADYYVALNYAASRNMTSSPKVRSWERKLIALSKLPSPAKETSFVLAILSAERRRADSLNRRRASEYECS